MSKDRIQIDGVWYVREGQPQIKPLQPHQLTNTINCIYETSNYCFEAIMIFRDDCETLYPDVSIEFTDKRNADYDDWKKDSSDNPIWMRGVFHGDDVAMIDTREMMDQEGINEFRAFLKHIETKGWINLDKEDDERSN